MAADPDCLSCDDNGAAEAALKQWTHLPAHIATTLRDVVMLLAAWPPGNGQRGGGPSLLPRTVTVRTTVTGPDGSTTDERTVPLAAGLNRQEWTVPVVDPARWWPHSLGSPTTVEVRTEVVLADDDPERTDDLVSHRVVRRT